MPRINNEVIDPCLYVNNKAKKMQQNNRSFSKKKKHNNDKIGRMTIGVGFVKEAHQQKWIFNVVLVKVQWQVDDVLNFTNLNQECPNDKFPL